MFWTTIRMELAAPVSPIPNKLEFQLIFKLTIKAKSTKLDTCLKIKKLLQPKLQMARLTFLIISSTLKLLLTTR